MDLIKDKLFWCTLVVCLGFMANAAFGQTAVSGAGAIAGSAAQAGSLAAGNVINIEAATIPTQSTLSYDGTYTLRNVPNVIVPNVYPTATCVHSSAFGGSVAGFGIGGGTSWEAVNCEHRENARLLQGMSKGVEAMEALCAQTNAASYSFCKKPVVTPVAAVEKVSDARTPVVIDSERQRKAAEVGLTAGQDGSLWKCQGNSKGSCDWVQAKMDPIAGNIR